MFTFIIYISLSRFSFYFFFFKEKFGTFTDVYIKRRAKDYFMYFRKKKKEKNIEKVISSRSHKLNISSMLKLKSIAPRSYKEKVNMH